MEVTVPKGVQGGQTLQIESPAGLISTTVPAGLQAGDTFCLQPVAVQPVVQATVVQPVAAIPAATLSPPSEWSKPMCGCCSHKDCGLACCCALAGPCVCCAYPSIEEAAGVPHQLGGYWGECCLLSGCADVGLALIGIPAVAQLVTRFILRRGVLQKYNIAEDGCTTCCCIFCCTPCAMCQQSNEMFEREGLVFDGCTRARRETPNELTVLVASQEP